jgi:membrane protein CcdC involved in cytochrome C biogenesis
VEWNYILRSLLICTITKYYLGDKIEKNEMGGTYHIWGREEVKTGFWWRNLKERYHLVYPGVYGRIY